MTLRFWEWQLAFRLIRSGPVLVKSFALFSVLGIAMVVAGFILTYTVLKGFDQAYEGALVGFNGSAVIFKEDAILNSDPVFEWLQNFSKNFPELEAVAFFYSETLLFHAHEMRGVQIKALPEKSFSQALARYRARPESKSGLYLGASLARKLENPTHVRVLPLSATRAKLRPLLSLEALVSLPVAGQFETGLSEFDNVFLLMDEASYERLGGDHTRFHGIELFSKSGDTLPQALLDTVRAEIDYPYTFLDWKELNAVFFQALGKEKTMFLVIAITIIGIAILNLMIMTAIHMAERSREWLVFKALGMTRRARHRLFFKQLSMILAAGLGLGVGGAAGLIALFRYGVTIPLSPDIYFLERLPIAWHGAAFLWATGGVLVAGSAAIYTALLLGRWLQGDYRLH